MVLTDSARLTWHHSQTFGDLVNFNPHVHVLADGVFWMRVAADDAEGRKKLAGYMLR